MLKCSGSSDEPGPGLSLHGGNAWTSGEYLVELAAWTHYMEKNWNNTKLLGLDQRFDTSNKTTCFTGHLTASPSKSTSHGGGRGSSLRRRFWTICRAGSSLLVLVKVADKAQQFNSHFLCLHQPNCSLKYKRLWLRLAEDKHSSATVKMYKRIAGVHFPKLGVCNKVQGHQITKEWTMAVWFVCVLAYCFALMKMCKSSN